MKALQPKDAFTVRMDPGLYDKMQQKLRSYRKGKSINGYINELIARDLLKERNYEEN